METQHIREVALQRGIALQALDQVTAMVQAHFGERTPKPADLDAFLGGLHVWEKLGMSQEAFYAMPPAWRLAQGWVLQPPEPRRRPSRPAAPEEVRKQWAHLPLTEQVTAYRAWADQQLRA
jgi:hypothetical protein